MLSLLPTADGPGGVAGLRERADTLETQCYVCGMARDAYEDLGLAPGSPSFETHLEVPPRPISLVSLATPP